jgi:hypothetical protein
MRVQVPVTDIQVFSNQSEIRREVAEETLTI